MSWKQQQYPWKYTTVFFNVANLLVSVMDMAGLLWAPHSVTRHPSNRRGGGKGGRVLVLVQMDGWLLVIHPNTPFCLSLGPTYHFSPQSQLENTKLHKLFGRNFRQLPGWASEKFRFFGDTWLYGVGDDLESWGVDGHWPQWWVAWELF